jgi:putative intracellular protease/amidase
MTKRILMVLTSHDEMGISGKKTGNWFDEVATPYYLFSQAGHEIALGSPKGGAAPLDPFSFDDGFMSDNTHCFIHDSKAQRALTATIPLRHIDYRRFDAVFFPGGYGQLWDLASDSYALQMIQDFISNDKPLAMVCHAPGILRDAKNSNGEPLVRGKALTGFSNAEDDELGLTPHLLFRLETTLKEKGARYTRSENNWEPLVVEDGALLTGQNPASAAPLAHVLLRHLS